jgi:hypothetical protein
MIMINKIRKPKQQVTDMSKRILYLLLVVFALPVQAERAFQLQDYAWQAQLGASDSLLQRVDLTADILAGLSQPNVADIAVFDVNGQMLPTRLQLKSPRIQHHEVELSFHRFARDEVARAGGTLTIDQQQIDTQNQQINRLEYQQQLTVTENRSDYIIELSPAQLAKGIHDIELEWTHQPASDFLKLDVQAANDLDHWISVQPEKNLFNGAGHSGEWITLSGLPAGYRYIRLVPYKQVSEFTLLKATGKYSSKTTVQDIMPDSRVVLTEDSKHAGFYHFQLPLKVTARRLMFNLESGYFLSGSLYASNAGFDKKRLIKSGFEQHNLDNLGANPGLDISAFHYQDWWFKADKPVSYELTVSFSYPAYELLFINNHHAPFTLAWGNYEATSLLDDLTPLLGKQAGLDIAQAGRVGIGEIHASGGEQRLYQDPVLPWLTWLLWGFLCAAVLLTARMAYTLYRDMNR